jgi:hypothetical protein
VRYEVKNLYSFPPQRRTPSATPRSAVRVGLLGGRFRGKFRGSVLQKICDLRLRPARFGVCLRPSRWHVFLPHLRVCAPERREYVLRLQEPKNEQKRKPQRSAAPPKTGNRSIGSKLRQSPPGFGETTISVPHCLRCMAIAIARASGRMHRMQIMPADGMCMHAAPVAAPGEPFSNLA